MAETTTVEGLARFHATLAAAVHQLGDMPAEDAAGRLVATGGASRAPIRTGRLASSVRAMKTGEGVSVGSSLAYAAVTEYGGGNNIPAQPYMRPALAYANAPIVALYKRDLIHIVNGIKGA